MAETIIGQGIVVDGEISGTDPVTIEGTVKGRITTENTVTVAADGIVEADVETPEVLVAGQVTGDVVAGERVELMADCRVVGDIKSARISIADGAAFKGHIDMDVE
jgi:cytoskeletal protein CcmA (bactofilin family)